MNKKTMKGQVILDVKGEVIKIAKEVIPRLLTEEEEQRQIMKQYTTDKWEVTMNSDPTVEPANDAVNHPSHYTSGKIEVIDFIEDQKLPYHLGNVVKYVSRAGKKDPKKTIEDLQKAEWYLNRYIEWLQSQAVM